VWKVYGKPNPPTDTISEQTAPNSVDYVVNKKYFWKQIAKR
jgi:hypothetical protein